MAIAERFRGGVIGQRRVRISRRRDKSLALIPVAYPPADQDEVSRYEDGEKLMATAAKDLGGLDF